MHTSYEDEPPRTLDRRRQEQAQLRRLIQIGNQLANLMEIASDADAYSLDVLPAFDGLVDAWRRQLARFRTRTAREALNRLKGGDS